MKVRRLIGGLLLVGTIAFGIMTKNTETVHSNHYNHPSFLFKNETLNREHNTNNDFRNTLDEEYYEEGHQHNYFENPREDRELERKFHPRRMPHHGHHYQRSSNR